MKSAAHLNQSIHTEKREHKSHPYTSHPKPLEGKKSNKRQNTQIVKNQWDKGGSVQLASSRTAP